ISRPKIFSSQTLKVPPWRQPGSSRCEKAALVMQDAGLPHVHQLDGGVLRYFEDTGHAPGWRGGCVVFDDRGALRSDLSPAGARAAP
ncbi:MAG: hypothetical protein ACKOD9_03200, partial [Rubrivivax sp.]